MKHKNFIRITLFFFTLLSLFLLSTCQKVPLNPYDEESVTEGYCTPLPTIEPLEGTYHKDISVSVTCTDEEAVIYYSLDESEPGTESSTYSSPIDISGDGTHTVVNVVAKSPEKNLSGVISASYTIEYLELLLQASGNGSVSPAGTVKVAQDGSLAITATPDSGFAFSHWSVPDGTGIDIADIYAESTTVIPTDTGGTIQANFDTGLSLTVTDDGHGSTTPSGEILVVQGMPRSISAEPDPGYRFKEWTIVSGSGASVEDEAAAETTITLTSGGVEIRADFELLEYSLTVGDDGLGTTNPSGVVTVQHGVPESITATADPGYQFYRWFVLNGNADFGDQYTSDTTVTLKDGNAEIQADFIALEADLTVDDDGNGSTTPSGTVNISQNVPYAISASPDSGYTFSHWTVEGGSGVTVADENTESTTVTLTDGDAAVRAHFIPVYTLTVSNDGNGTTEPSGSVQVTHGVSTDIGASASANYVFDSWSVESGTGVTIGDTGLQDTTVTLTSGDATIQANFLPEYTLTVTDDGDGTTSPSGNMTVVHGETTSITATPGTGSMFDQWSVTSGAADIDDPLSASTTVILESGDATVQADFVHWDEQKILSESGGEFGFSVSIAGNYAIVGNPTDDDNGNDAGAAYIYYRNQGGTDNWGMVKKLTAADGTVADQFGNAVSLSGDYALIGASHDDDNGLDSGSAYIFYRNQGGADNWGQVRKLVAGDGYIEDSFGDSVSLTVDYALIGAYGDDDNGTGSGSAYLFYRNQGGSDIWGELKKFTASDGASSDLYGQSVAIDGDYILIGSNADDDIEADSGSAYIYYRDEGGTDNWGEVKKITAGVPEAAERFAFSVDLSADYAVIGAYRADVGGTDSGAAYIFNRNQGGTDNWGQVTKITASDSAANDFFGISVATNGDYALVGAYANDDAGTSSGSVYIFYKDKGGMNNWGELSKITASNASSGDKFGWDVSITNGYAIIGANFTPAAYIFEED